MKEDKINYKILNILFIKKDFIKNYDSNYEKYLNEFVNNSRFVTDNGNKTFVLNKNQSNKEPDSSNGNYDLEYKLFFDEESLLNKRNFSKSITIDSNGAIIYGSSKQKGSYNIINLKKLISQYSLTELNKIKNEKPCKSEDKKVKKFIKKLELQKNIIFLIPQIYYYDSKKIDEKKLKFIIDKFSSEFKAILQYRKQYTNKDTYIAFFVEDYVVFTKEVELKLVLYDKVNINNSPKFKQIEDIANPFGF